MPILYDSLSNQEQLFVKRIINSFDNRDIRLYFGIVNVNEYLFRATSYFPEGQLRKKHIQHPCKLLSKLGRCNYPQEPAFYVANCADGALMEKSLSYRGDANGDECILLSRWKVLKEFFVIDFYFRSIENIDNPALHKEILKRNEFIMTNNPSSYPKIIADLTYVGDKFSVNDDSIYPFTSSICNVLYRKQINGKFISGVTYTGAAFCNYYGKSPNNYTNAAIIPELVNSNDIILVDVLKLKVNGGDYSFEILEATEKTETIKNIISLKKDNVLSEARKKEIFQFLKQKQ